MAESDIKRACEDYLQYRMNLGELVFVRLNAGEFIEVRGTTRRKIRGAPAGASDLFILKGKRAVRRGVARNPSTPPAVLQALADRKAERGER